MTTVSRRVFLGVLPSLVLGGRWLKVEKRLPPVSLEPEIISDLRALVAALRTCKATPPIMIPPFHLNCRCVLSPVVNVTDTTKPKRRTP